MDDWKIGALSDEQLRELVKKELIRDFAGKPKHIDGSSFDLHLSNQGWEVKSTAKLSANETVKQLIRKQNGVEIDLSQTELKKGRIYILKLKEKLSLQEFRGKYGFYGRASGRSSIGRLDVLTRLIVDRCPKYDEVPPNYSGELFLEVVPLSFDVKVKEGIALNQLRIFHGKPDLSVLQSDELGKYAPMLYRKEGDPISADQDLLRVNLQPAPNFLKSQIIAFRAKKYESIERAIDLTLNNHDPKMYFESVGKSEANDVGLKMEEERFYIFRSLERLYLPNDVSVTCVAYSENLGELRIHYAGFAHPNFGRSSKKRDNTDSLGAPLIFEARCHSFPVTIREEEHFARIMYYKMSEPTDTASSYSNQELQLSNYFKNWKENVTD